MAKLKKSRFVVNFPALLLCVCVLLGFAGSTQVYASDYTVGTTLWIEVRYIDGTSKGQYVDYDPNGTTFSFDGTNIISEVVVSQAVTGSFEVDSDFITYCTIRADFNSAVYMRHLVSSGSEVISSTLYSDVGDYESGILARVQSSITVPSGATKISTNVKLIVGTTSVGSITISDIRYDYSSVSSDEQTNRSILQYIKDIFSNIKNLPQNIANNIEGFFDGVVGVLTEIDNVITSLPAKIKDAFTSIFDSWFESDAELDSSVSDGSGVVDGVGSAESNLIQDALGDINTIDFNFNFSTELGSALLFLLPFQDRLFNSFGILKDVIIVSLTIGLVTLIIGRGLRAFGNYGGKK